MGAVKKIIAETIERMDENDRELVLVWAEKAQEISNREALSKRDKLQQLRQLETSPAVQAFLKCVLSAIKQHTWDDRSWPARGALIGFTVGAAAFGGKAAGVAAFGGAVGINLYLLTSAGGALLGTLVFEIKNAGKNKNSNK